MFDRLSSLDDGGGSKRMLRELLPRTNSPPDPPPTLPDISTLIRGPSQGVNDSADGGQARSLTTQSPSPFGSWARDNTDATSLTSLSESPSLGLDKASAQKWIDRELSACVCGWC